jgi:hypothetical protein
MTATSSMKNFKEKVGITQLKQEAQLLQPVIFLSLK